MPQFVEPRVLRLSWQPSADAAGVPVADWVSRLKKRLRVFRRDKDGRELVLQDVNEPGADKAEIRDGAWTDFVAVFTIEYCISDAAVAELQEALHRRDEAGHLLWLVRLEEGNPCEAMVGDVEPWRDGAGWTVLPAPHPAEPLSCRPERIDSDLQQKCVDPLRTRGPGGETEPAEPGSRP